jgi:hypothetical protein
MSNYGMRNMRTYSSPQRVLTSTLIDGVSVKVGDYVSFKSDVEQGGKITKIVKGNYGAQLSLYSEHGFHGDYIGGQTTTTESASDCWLEG